MWKVIKAVFYVIAPPGILAGGNALGALCWAKGPASPNLQAFSVGLAAGTALWLLVGKRLEFFQTFEHELTHLLVGLCFFKRPHSFAATEDQGGYVKMYGDNFFITLAPYFVPTLSLFALILYPVIQPQYRLWFFGCLGLLSGYHLATTFQEFGFDQTDVQRCGKVFSVLFCLLGNLLFYGLIIGFVAGGPGGALAFLERAGDSCAAWGRLLAQWAGAVEG